MEANYKNVFKTIDQLLWSNFLTLYSSQPDRLYFPCYDYDYLLVKHIYRKNYTGKCVSLHYFIVTYS
jgi:hypothetical protein